MSPRLATLLALAGVLLAGIPLPALTRSREAAEPAPTTVREQATTACYANVRFTGQPAELVILHEGEELARLPAGATDSPWEPELALPPIAEGDVLELEVMARWETPAAQQAVTLTLEPARLPARSDTQWAEGDSLHNLFTFSW